MRQLGELIVTLPDFPTRGAGIRACPFTSRMLSLEGKNACPPLTSEESIPSDHAMPRSFRRLRSHDQIVARRSTRGDDLVPGSPGAIEFADVGQSEMGLGGSVPILF